MNTALGQRVLTQVRRHPERHDQDSFNGLLDGRTLAVSTIRRSTCGSTACLAGWATILSAPPGSRIVSDYDLVHFPSGTSEDIAAYAAKALELDEDQAEAIFYCFENATAIERLQYLVEHPDATAYDLRNVYA
jgi:hypothetical protein